MKCPKCGSSDVIKNGSLGNGKAKFKCNICGRQFVEDPQKQPLSDAHDYPHLFMLNNQLVMIDLARRQQS